MVSSDIAPRINKLAEVTIKFGLGLQAGQELIITAPLEGIQLARAVTEQAYAAGASLVTTLFNDDALTLARFKHASDASFDKAATWLFDGIAGAYKSGAARLAIRGDDPMLLAHQDPARVSRLNRTETIAGKEMRRIITGFDTNWCIVATATPAWAKLVFPDDPADVALAKLWEAIFAASRVNTENPVEAWREHDSKLHGRAKAMTAKQYKSILFHGPGTELEVGLVDGHQWWGGSSRTKSGIACNPNIPTEEIFSTPHKERVNGTVTSTKPLSYNGTLIKDIVVQFKDGRAVEAHSQTGQDVLRKLIETDEGAARLGEVALVPHFSPISQSGLVFFNTLFDENAATHIAFGQAYNCITGGDRMSEEELTAKGVNRSLVHTDWMIGSDKIDIDGMTQAGEREPVMRQGNWAFEI